MDNVKTGRYAEIVSLSFSDKFISDIPQIIEKEAQKGCDIIILPETWNGLDKIEDTKGETVKAMSELAKKYGIYIISPMYRKNESIKKINSSILIDRNGEMAGIYDKAYPYWEEFDTDPATEAGTDVPVFDTDFGKIGLAICFDANFPVVWEMLSRKGAELVLWSSAYSAGTTLQAHAINHNYYIVSSTLCGDCIAYDITGKEILYEKSEDAVNISRIKLDLDKRIFHENFNIEKRDKLLADYKGKIRMECMEREQWFTLEALEPGIFVRELANEYGLEELVDYKRRSKEGIDKIRGFKLGC